MDIAAIVDQTQTVANGSQHVVITGGEPMLPAEIELLCQHLSECNFHITIETAGTIYRNLKCDLMSISPKLSNSTPGLDRAGRWLEKHEQQRHRPKIVGQMVAQYDCQLKFVVAEPEDLAEINTYLAEVKGVDRSQVMLMPEGIDQQTLIQRESWLKDICHQEGFTFCQREHIFWYGNKRGT